MRLYVLLRKDLDPTYAAVQAGHAVAGFCLHCSSAYHWLNGKIVYLSVSNEGELKKILDSINDKHYYAFKEPDLNNQTTSIAVLSKDRLFNHLSLWK